MIDELRALHLRGATGTPRSAMLNGRDHLVVPVVALMEGVIHAVNASTPEFVPASTLARAAASWNGRPVTLGHPTKNGRQCSANDPEIMESHRIGTIFKSRMEGTKLLCEAWIDKALVSKLRPEMLDRLLAAEHEEVSVGAFVMTDATPGDYRGKSYKATWTETSGDHLAFLPGGRGACSGEMGCGAHRAAEAPMHLVTAEGMDMETDKGVVGRLATFLRSLMPRGWGDDEVKQGLREALYVAEPASRHGEILRVTNNTIVYALYPPPATPYGVETPYAAVPSLTYWSRGYTFDTATRQFTITPERTQVEPATVYEPLHAAAGKECPVCGGTGQVTTDGSQHDCEACGGRGTMKTAEASASDTAARVPELKAAECRCHKEMSMDKKTLIDALAKSPFNPVKSLKALEALDEVELTAASDYVKTKEDEAEEEKKAHDAALKGAADKLAETEGALKAAQAQAIPADQLAELKALAESKRADDAAKKADLVGQLKTAAAGVYTEAELGEKPLAELLKMAQMAKVAAPVDFSGRGVPVSRVASKVEDFAPPNPYEAGLKALQSKAVN